MRPKAQKGSNFIELYKNRGHTVSSENRNPLSWLDQSSQKDRWTSSLSVAVRKGCRATAGADPAAPGRSAPAGVRRRLRGRPGRGRSRARRSRADCPRWAKSRVIGNQEVIPRTACKFGFSENCRWRGPGDWNLLKIPFCRDSTMRNDRPPQDRFQVTRTISGLLSFATSAEH